MRKSALLLLALLILPLAGFGCGPAKVSPTLDSIKSGEAEYEWGDTGTKVRVGEDVSIPDNFPKDVPLYSNSTTQSVSYNEEQGLYAFVVLLTDDSIATVSDWYANQLAGEGWTQTGQFNADGMNMLMLSKGNRNLVISIGPNDEDGPETIITLTVTEM